MLGIRNYTSEYIDACRARVATDIAAFEALSAPATFEVIYFNNLLIVLDHLFVHRLRTVEGKDGNPLNEVRMLTNSLVENGGTLKADITIKYNPAKSVLGHQPGDAIQLTQADFTRLSEAFFGEIEHKFVLAAQVA